MSEPSGLTSLTVLDSLPFDEGVDAIIASGHLVAKVARGMTIRRQGRRNATRLEVFIREIVFRLGFARAQFVSEIVGIGVPDITAQLDAMVGAGVLSRVGDRYVAREECESSLRDRESLPFAYRESISFLLFPRVEEAIALEDREVWLPLQSPGSCPIPATLADRPLDQVLTDLWKEGAIADLPTDTLEFDPTERTLGDTAGAFTFRGAVVGGPRASEVHLSIRQEQKSPGRGEKYRTMVLRKVPRLAHYFLRPYRLLEEQGGAQDFWRAIGVPGEVGSVSRLGGIWFQAPLDSDAAQAIGAKHLLSSELGISLSDGETTLEAVIRFIPSDDKARFLLARDRVVTLIRSAPPDHSVDLGAAIKEAGAAFDISRKDLRSLDQDSVASRLWELHMYGPLYALRADEDFPHG